MAELPQRRNSSADEVQQYLGEAVSRSRPELRPSEQLQLLHHVIELIDNYNSGDLAGMSTAIASDETRGVVLRPSAIEPSRAESDAIGFVITCKPDGTVEELVHEGLGLGSRLTTGTNFSTIVSPFYLRRAARFLRNVRQQHACHDCALSMAGPCGMLSLFCSGFRVGSHMVVIGTREPLSISIPGELERLGDLKSDTLKPVLRELLAWRSRNPAAPSTTRSRIPFSEPSSKVGRRRLLELAAHDLRNSISGILAASQYLIEDAAGALEPHQTVVLSSIESSARLALQLIQALAEIPLIRLGAPDLELCPTDILAVVQQSVSGVRPMADTMKVELHVTAEEHTPIFRGDPAKLHEAFHGLMVNAIGFSPIGGNVNIVVGSRAGEATIALHREYTAPPRRFLSPASGGASVRSGRRKFSDVYAALLLARARQIVKAHGGGLRVDSHGEHSQLWTVMLPIVLSQRTHSAEAKGT